MTRVCIDCEKPVTPVHWVHSHSADDDACKSTGHIQVKPTSEDPITISRDLLEEIEHGLFIAAIQTADPLPKLSAMRTWVTVREMLGMPATWKTISDLVREAP